MIWMGGAQTRSLLRDKSERCTVGFCNAFDAFESGHEYLNIMQCETETYEMRTVLYNVECKVW